MDQKPLLLVNTLPLLGKETGVGNYTRHLAQAVLARRDLFSVTFYHGFFSQSLPHPTAPKERLLALTKEKLKKSPLLRSLGKKALSLMRSTRNSFHPALFDCYVEPNFILLPQIKARKSLLTVHDFSCFLYPKLHPSERVRYLEANFAQSLERADRIVLVSEAMRKEALTLFALNPQKITVIPNGLDHTVFRPLPTPLTEQLLAPYKLPLHFLLFAGTFEPRKNLTNLLAAYALLPSSLKERFPLILCGAEGWKNADIFEMIKKQQRFVRYLGYVPLQVLAALYYASPKLLGNESFVRNQPQVGENSNLRQSSAELPQLKYTR